MLARGAPEEEEEEVEVTNRVLSAWLVCIPALDVPELKRRGTSPPATGCSQPIALLWDCRDFSISLWKGSVCAQPVRLLY